MKKICNIKKKNNKYIVILNDGKELKLYSETLIKFNLLKPRVLSDAEIKEILEYNSFYEAFNECLKLINRKLRTKKELLGKLKDYSQDITNKVINKCEELGYLNESTYISSFVHDEVNLGLKGPIYIKNKLIKLGLNEEIITREIDNISKDIWIDKINKIITKNINSNHTLSKKAFIIKLKKYLINLGYDVNTVNDILDNMEFKENEHILEKTYFKEERKLNRKYSGEELENKIKYNLYKKGFTLSDIVKFQNKD